LNEIGHGLQRRFTNTEMCGSLLLHEPPTSSEGLTVKEIGQGLQRRFTDTEMCGSLVLHGPPTTSDGPTVKEIGQGLKRRFTDTEMCGTLILHGPPTSPTLHPRSKWFDPMDEVHTMLRGFGEIV